MTAFSDQQMRLLRARAISLLARREYSRQQMQQRLQQYSQSLSLRPNVDLESEPSVGPAATVLGIEHLLDELVQKGLLSDHRAAQSLIRQGQQRFGVTRILRNLKEQGIDCEQSLPEFNELREQEEELARKVWQKKFSALPNNANEYARQARFLSYRGFRQDIIRRILKSSLAAGDEDM